MSVHIDEMTDTLIKELVPSRNYHRILVKELERKLIKFSKKYKITITLDK